MMLSDRMVPPGQPCSLLHELPDLVLGPARPPSRVSPLLARRPAGVPFLLLLATGACLGLSNNLAKLAGEVDLSPLAFLAWSVSGACVLVSALAAVRGELPPLNRRTVEYFVLSAFVTIAASSLIFVAATPAVGVGFVAPVAALPPLLTYVGALALGLERFHAGRAAGVLFALAGAAWIAFVELTLPDAATFWIGLTLLAPVLLAIGNLYRTLRWPPGLSSESLAPGMLGAAALMLIGAGFLPHPTFSLALPVDRPLPMALVCVQAVVFALQFVLLLELQKRGGPVFLSLIGSVGAMIGVPAAILLLGESPPAGLASGAVAIVLGVALLNTGRRRPERSGRAVPAAGSRHRSSPRPRTGSRGTSSGPSPSVFRPDIGRPTAVHAPQGDSARHRRQSAVPRVA